MQIGSHGCGRTVEHRGTRMQENKGERGTNGRSVQYLMMHDHCKKISKSAGMIAVIREGKGGEYLES